MNPLGLTWTGRNVVAVDGAAVPWTATPCSASLIWSSPATRAPAEFEREQKFPPPGAGAICALRATSAYCLQRRGHHHGHPGYDAPVAAESRPIFWTPPRWTARVSTTPFQIFLNDPSIKTVLVNIFAGLNRCDHLAQGHQGFLKQEFKPRFQRVVVRMAGNREAGGLSPS